MTYPAQSQAEQSPESQSGGSGYQTSGATEAGYAESDERLYRYSGEDVEQPADATGLGLGSRPASDQARTGSQPPVGREQGGAGAGTDEVGAPAASEQRGGSDQRSAATDQAEAPDEGAAPDQTEAPGQGAAAGAPGQGAAAPNQTEAPGQGAAATDQPAAADSQGELSPGDVPHDPVAALWGTDEIGRFRDQWRQLQMRFVDEPQNAANEAASLVDQAVHTLTTALGARKQELDSWRAAEGDDTEVLRMALRRYRDFLDRLLGA